MSTRKRTTKADPETDQMTPLQVIELARVAREVWRHEVANGRMKLDPKRMRAYDASLAELKQLVRG